MLDIQLLRTDLDAVARRLADRPYVLDQAAFRSIEEERKRLQTRTQELAGAAERARQADRSGEGEGRRRRGADGRGERGERRAGGSGEGAGGRAGEAGCVSRDDSERARTRACRSGAGAEDNVEVRRVGTPRTFGFAPKDHVDLGTALGMIDFERAAKIAGARFVVMSGAVARLHRAITQLMLDVHTQEHGYVEVYVPYMVNKDSAFGTGQLPKLEEDLFAVPRGNERLYLIPTAEVPVTNLVRDEIVPLEKLPLKFVCHSPCFRSEAGAAGKDTRGMIRQHQFDKVELVQIVHPERSYAGPRGAHRPRGDDPEAAGVAVPHGDAVHRGHGVRRQPRPTTSRSGCPGRTPTARSRRARTSRRSRRGGCRRGSGTRRASPSRCTR